MQSMCEYVLCDVLFDAEMHVFDYDTVFLNTVKSLI